MHAPSSRPPPCHILWCNSNASSSYLLNGDPGKRVLHCRGMRQGDPLSPMLFLLAMAPLSRLFIKAQEVGLLQRISSGCDNFRMALYADDATLFIKPTKKEFEVTKSILQIFEDTSGLASNMAKIEFYLIRCAQANLDFLFQGGSILSDFTCTYLGLPLYFKKPTREMLQSMIQKIAKRLPG
jgi:hypothetical protein